jgi:hypothetical protein
MKKIVFSLIMALLSISCSKELYNSSSWENKHVKIDGNLNEWPNPLRFYDQESGISYCISNDRYNLYLACSISNELMQIKILRSGLEFGIDTLGKKTFPVSIRYPAENSGVTAPRRDSELAAQQGIDRKPDRSGFKLKLLAEATEMQLTGFKPQVGKIISLSTINDTGISAAINFDSKGIMNYEAVIPFSAFYHSALVPSDSDRVFNYELKINPASRSDNSSYGNGGSRGGGGRSGMGSGGMHGGGMRGGMGGSGMRSGGMRGGGMNGNGMSGENRENNFQRSANLSGTTKTTIRLKLAYN